MKVPVDEKDNVKGVCIQNGIPTPNKPIPIETLVVEKDYSEEKKSWIKIRNLLNELGTIEYQVPGMRTYRIFTKLYGKLMDAIYEYQKAAKLDEKYGTRVRNGRDLKRGDNMSSLQVCIKKAKEALEKEDDIAAEIKKSGSACWSVVCGRYYLDIHIKDSKATET